MSSSALAPRPLVVEVGDGPVVELGQRHELGAVYGGFAPLHLRKRLTGHPQPFGGRRLGQSDRRH